MILLNVQQRRLFNTVMMNEMVINEATFYKAYQ